MAKTLGHKRVPENFCRRFRGLGGSWQRWVSLNARGWSQYAAEPRLETTE
jgi:hypothetical protein